MTQQSSDDAHVERRLRQEALLKEYEICEKEVTDTSSLAWFSTTVFLAAWTTALGIVAANLDKVEGFLWLFAGVVIAAQLFWWMFLRRSFQVMQFLFLRQRQIEAKLGMLKSIAITVADDERQLEQMKGPLRPEMGAELVDFNEKRKRLPEGLFERCVVDPATWPLRRLVRPGRGALYGLSILVAFAWLVLAIWNTCD